jgi:gluconokinase
MILIVTGVAGSGKTTVGRAAAERLEWRFRDADDLHDAQAITRIRAGLPLDDDSRGPWLQRVRVAIDEAIAAGEPTVFACSALKERYRQVLAGGVPHVRFVFLAADEELLRGRLTDREGHFAGPSLLASQLAALEPPAYGLHLDARLPVDELAERIAEYARERPA